MDDFAHVTILGSKFSSNTAGPPLSNATGELSRSQGRSWGGALFLGSNPIANTALHRQRGITRSKIVGVEFDGNNATNGGAVSCIHVTQMSMTFTQFTNNSGVYGGALYVSSGGDRDPQQYFLPEHYVSGEKTLFSGNKAYGNGGALFLHVGVATATLDRVGISPLYISNLTSNGSMNNNEDDIFFESCEFRSNYGSTSGGAWDVERGRVGCKDCVFNGNFVNQSVGLGGAISVHHQAAFHGRNISMTVNSAFSGGAIFSHDAIVDIVNASITGNMAQQNGGGVYMYITERTIFRFGIFARVNATSFHQNQAGVGGRSLEVLCLSQDNTKLGDFNCKCSSCSFLER